MAPSSPDAAVVDQQDTDASTARVQGTDFDVVVVGAGMAGLYLLHKLRALGLSATVLETGADVGGTWYWNRYPGARCDIQSTDYSYSWDPDLHNEWTWSEKFAPQPEILRYLQLVADKHDLRGDISFNTRVDAAVWDDDATVWRISTSKQQTLTARFYVMATGCLSMPKEVDIDGTGRFDGEVYFTSRWPHAGVDFTGKRVAVIGTGSSAIQSIPIIAAQASQLTVFQRTANFSIPAWNGPTPADKLAEFTPDPAAYRAAARRSGAGVPLTPAVTSALAVSDEERLATYEQAWQRGGIMEFLNTYADHLSVEAANELLAEFVRNKIRAQVHDPETAEALCPKDYPIGTKRICLDTDYYTTFNEPHVRLVDLRRHPIETITETGIDLVGEHLEFDAIVFATGFDAMTGAIVNVDITGRDGIDLKTAWEHGPETYLGVMAHGFPNLFMVTGPQSPSVLSNMAVSIEQHVEWIADCLAHMGGHGYTVIEPSTTAVDGWLRHAADFSDLTLMHKANSWYVGANVPGKARVVLPYVGGVENYRAACQEVADRDYLGLARTTADGRTDLNDGVVRSMQPDVMMMVDMMATLGLPTMESMSADDARAFSTMTSAQRPPGPDVGEVIDGTLPGPAGDLAYRLYRPASSGPHPVVVYYHGGGWVIGNQVSDDPFCRDLCARTDSVVISVDYRHAPETRFPGAVDDAFAALHWVAAHMVEFGGIPGRLAVAGWSAGGNLAAVVAQLARDANGPELCGQLLITPVTDGSMSSPSFVENGEGKILTAALMTWFFDHYADAAERTDPRVAPLRGNLAGLPPTVVMTADFDPLRDEGIAYADALRGAGNEVHHVRARGHIHTSVHSVDLLPSGAPVRAELAAAVRGFFD